MRIAFSNAGLDWRGTETDTLILARGLMQRGHDVVVLCRPHSAIAARLQGEIAIEPVLSPLDFDPMAIARCRAVLAKHRTQVVVTQKDKDLRLSGVAARTLGIPVLVRHVTDRPLKPGLRYRLMFGHVGTHHLANSVATLATLRASAPWLKADVPVIPNGIEFDVVDQAAAADLSLPNDAIAVGFIGAFEMRKGIIDFAEAWPRIAEAIPQAHAVIAGAGAREADFRAALERAPRVHWLGFRRDAVSVMKALDVLVFASRFEGFGLVLAEAMAAGVTPVAYATSNIPEIVEDGVTGLLVEAGNSAQLAAAVIRACRDNALRHRVGEAARAHVREHFSAERMVEAHEKLLHSIVATSSM